ncbi:MAG: hypothetical protein U5K36_04890 [Roseovarius sp.]|nr:hypothetical protein [Roseovarius sp.]
MAFYIQLTFIIASTVIGLGLGDGRFAGSGHPSLEFLTPRLVPGRRWADYRDPRRCWAIRACWRGFSSARPTVCPRPPSPPRSSTSPMPLAIMWGAAVFGAWPDATAWIGIALIIGSGLYLLWRESVNDDTLTAETTLIPALTSGRSA